MGNVQEKAKRNTEDLSLTAVKIWEENQVLKVLLNTAKTEARWI